MEFLFEDICVLQNLDFEKLSLGWCAKIGMQVGCQLVFSLRKPLAHSRMVLSLESINFRRPYFQQMKMTINHKMSSAHITFQGMPNFVMSLGEPHQNMPPGYALVPPSSPPWDPQGNRELCKISTPMFWEPHATFLFFKLMYREPTRQTILDMAITFGTRHSLDVRHVMPSWWSYLNLPPFFLNKCNNSKCWVCLLLTLFILYC